jgi:hypothetical protein
VDLELVPPRHFHLPMDDDGISVGDPAFNFEIELTAPTRMRFACIVSHNVQTSGFLFFHKVNIIVQRPH